MAARKSERLMNLVIALLVSKRFLTKDQIRDSVQGYETDDGGAFDRMFERDKKELRELGIDIEIGANDAYFDDEQGYRIRRDSFELADVQFTTEEAAVVGLAAQVWQHAGLASNSSDALLKLKAAGVDVDASALNIVEPQLAASESSFDAMWEAATQRIPVTFAYRRPGENPASRHVEPWGVFSWHGRWYMAGFDTDREAERVFRLTRVAGDVAFSGEPGFYDIPDGTDLRAIATRLSPPPPVAAAVVRARKDRCQDLRRRAESSESIDAEWDELSIGYASPWELAAEVASFGADATVVSPDEVIAEVVSLLTSAAGERV